MLKYPHTNEHGGKNMTDRQLRKASRTDLLKLLLEQKKEAEAMRRQIDQLQEQLQQRQITIDQSGSLAEAALKLSGILMLPKRRVSTIRRTSADSVDGRKKSAARWSGKPGKNVTACWNRPSKWPSCIGMNTWKNAVFI